VLDRLRPHLTYANVMATMALFVALGGGAYAAGVVPFAKKAAFAKNAGKVDGFVASVVPRSKTLLPLGANGKLPLSAIPDLAIKAGPTGPAGAVGPEGPPGTPGAPGQNGSNASSVVMGRIVGLGRTTSPSFALGPSTPVFGGPSGIGPSSTVAQVVQSIAPASAAFTARDLRAHLQSGDATNPAPGTTIELVASPGGSLVCQIPASGGTGGDCNSDPTASLAVPGGARLVLKVSCAAPATCPFGPEGTDVMFGWRAAG
jgi:hypothetical protein